MRSPNASIVDYIDVLISNGTTPIPSLLPTPYSIIPTLVFALFGVTLIVVIVVGNGLVVLSIYNDTRLQRNRQNLLIGSLAIADMLVGLLVMPLSLTVALKGEWIMGIIVCELWLALDVLFVTASILHLCAISLDRYWSVTLPMSYPPKRTSAHMIRMSIIAWLASFAISFPPLLGWRPKRRPRECEVSTDIGYVLYSSMGSFYVPVMILIVVYTRIYWISHQALKQRVKQTEKNQQILNTNKGARSCGPVTGYSTAAISGASMMSLPTAIKRAVSVAHGGNGTLLVTTHCKQLKETKIGVTPASNGTAIEEDSEYEKVMKTDVEQRRKRAQSLGIGLGNDIPRVVITSDEESIELAAVTKETSETTLITPEPTPPRHTGLPDNYYEFPEEMDYRMSRRYKRLLRQSAPDVIMHASTPMGDGDTATSVMSRLHVATEECDEAEESQNWENNTLTVDNSGSRASSCYGENPEQDERYNRNTESIKVVLKVIFDKNRTWITQMEKRMKQRAHLKKRLKRLKQKERQATILLGLILIGFIACWLPFFLVYLLQAINVDSPALIFNVFFWLGYCNSGVNPVIYTIFQKDFRLAMHKQIKRYAPCGSRF